MSKYTINKPIGSRMIFSGGAEPSPLVEIVQNTEPGLHYGEKIFFVHASSLLDNEEGVKLSAETMKAILEWGERE
jgi:hypothetical protein